MTSYTRERDEFIALATAEGLTLDAARALLRYATTLHRLAEAQCNGDWPADNGQRKVEFCPQCEGGFAPSSFRRSRFASEGGKPQRICPDCHTQERVLARLGALEHMKRENGLHAMQTSLSQECGCMKVWPIFGGDPRGAVLRLATPSHPYDPSGAGRGGADGLYVPARRRGA